MKRSLFLMLVACILLAAPLEALNVNDYRFHSIPETSYYGGIHSITKDHIGRIWFSGSDAVYMYDGISFTRQNEKLVAHDPDSWWTFLQVVSAADECIYVGTNFGLMRYSYDDETFDLILEGKISYVTADCDGVLWLIRNDSVESYIPGTSGAVTNYPFTEDMAVNTGNLTLSCSRGHVYVASQGVLYELDQKTGAYKVLTRTDSEKSQIRDVESYAGNHYVLTAKDGIYSYSDDWEPSGRFRLPPEYEKTSVAKELFLDENGILWAATQSGLFIVDTKTSRTQMLRSNIHYPYSLPNNSVWTIYPDPDSGVWIGTYGGKLAYMPVSDSGGNWFKPTPGGLSHSIVSCFAEDSKGNLWIGTEGGGVNYWDRENDRYIYYTQENNSGVHSNMIKKLHYGDDGRLYISSFNGGMQVYDSERNAFVDIVSGGTSHLSLSVYDFVKEGRSGYWLSDPDSPLAFWNLKNGIVENVQLKYAGREVRPKIEAMFRNADGCLSLVTSQGLYELDPSGKIIDRRYLSDVPYAKNDLSCYCCASDSKVWFGTRGGGVNVLSKDGIYRNFVDAAGNGLEGKTIFGMLEDEPTGDIWFSTDDGLFMYDKSADAFLRSTIDTHNLCGAYYVRSCFKTKSGEMLFGGTDGFIIFDPAKLGSNQHKPRPFFVDLKINSEFVYPSTPDSPLDRDVAAMGRNHSDGFIRLSHRQSNFEIFFSSDSYQDAGKNIYAYRMTGLSDNWYILPQGQRSVAFYDLPTGKYTFELKSANGDGLWGDEVISLDFKVTPHPLLSVWAWVIYALLLSVSVFLVYMYVGHKKKFKEELDQKDAELSELYSKKYVAGPSEIVVTTLEDELLKKALSFIEKNMDNHEYNVEDFVADMAMGRTALYQKIHNITGLSIKEFILDIRLKRAVRLLEESDKTVSEISYMTGFVNPKYFTTIFRKHHGVTPSAYRKRHEARI